MTALVPLNISGIAIRQRAEGRYCLNDLHRAAIANGAHQRTKEPGKFLASETTKELIRELEKTTQDVGSSPLVTIEGRHGGTFVVLELVYAYAMWISAVFYLTVIRTYHAQATRMLEKPRGPITIAERERREEALNQAYADLVKVPILFSNDEYMAYKTGQAPALPVLQGPPRNYNLAPRHSGHNYWKPAEDQVLVQGVRDGKSYAQMAESLPGRSHWAVKNRISVLRKDGNIPQDGGTA